MEITQESLNAAAMLRTQAKIEAELSSAIRAASDLSLVLESVKMRHRFVGDIGLAANALNAANALIAQLERTDAADFFPAPDA